MESNNNQYISEKEIQKPHLLSIPTKPLDYEKQKSFQQPKNQKDPKPLIKKKQNNITDSEIEFAEPQIENSFGEIPSPRFGHSLVMIDSAMLCLFGGAVEKNKKQ